MSRAIAGTVLAAWLCPLAHAQSAANTKPAEAKLEFEVASIKRSAGPAAARSGKIRRAVLAAAIRAAQLQLHYRPQSDRGRL